MSKILVTGIKPTGTPHLGNYLGALRPALKLSESLDDCQSYYFIADYHSLTVLKDAQKFRENYLDVASTWLALEPNPQKITLYRQSSIPEIFELSAILANYTPKGDLNRAHAYKAMTDKNREKGNEDLDHGVNAGLFTYPILMASDILVFDADIVPVGADQAQHVEMCRDIAQRFNHYHGDIIKQPDLHIKKEVGAIPGLDGRKMSKSYNNTIPLFCPEKKLRKLFNKLKTDSLPPEAPKETKDSLIFQLFQHFATDEEIANEKKSYQEGISWGQAKANLFEVANRELKGPREKYDYYMKNPEEVHQLIAKGDQQVREVASKNMDRIRKAIGRI
jgi:tryptophanyl-tRNA synthetase